MVFKPPSKLDMSVAFMLRLKRGEVDCGADSGGLAKPVLSARDSNIARASFVLPLMAFSTKTGIRSEAAFWAVSRIASSLSSGSGEEGGIEGGEGWFAMESGKGILGGLFKGFIRVLYHEWDSLSRLTFYVMEN